MPQVIKSVFRALSAVSNRLAGQAAFLLFTTPLRTGRLTAAEKRLAARGEAKFATAKNIGFMHRGKRIAAYMFGNRPNTNAKKVVLVHGWMSGARYMLAMVDPLLAMGYQVVCFDLPAHGRSEGKRTGLVQCAEALAALIGEIGDVEIVVAHSFGGAVTAYMLNRLRPGALGTDGQVVLLASPNQLSSVTQGFSNALGLSDAARLVFERKLSRSIGATLAEMDGNLLFAEAGYPLRVLHCVDDSEVPIAQSRRYLELDGDVRLTELAGLGHRRILYHPKAIDALIAAL
jgi:pimeloyl-ACP methyl ester carboxylesterase